MHRAKEMKEITISAESFWTFPKKCLQADKCHFEALLGFKVRTVTIILIYYEKYL